MTREKWLQFMGAACIALFLVTFNNVALVVLLRTSTYYRDVAIATAAAFVIFNYISFVTHRLDGHLDWTETPVGRLAAQGLVGVGGGAWLAYAIAYAQYRWIDPEHVFGTESFGEVEFPVIVVFIVFINCLYGGVSYYRARESKRPPAAPTGPPAPPAEPAAPPPAGPPAYLTGLVVNNGHRKIQVPSEQIALICLEDGVTWVVTFNNARYHVDEPLQTVQERLNPGSFFRVNRQTIIQLSACYSYESAEYGKIKLRLVPPLSSELLISQKTAPAFRKWMQR
ncbi:MAG: LytTR family transcriptional regulator [Cytophagales bacterium]|nr:LytTR family transcriptional regulator [Cytophagales bacterium]